ncbi:MAG: response regulator [Acidobacteriota bacterium]|nr:response regulator [Acidobacteriota bacterium]
MTVPTRILVVEDDENSRKAVSALLEMAGYVVVGAKSLEEARQCIGTDRFEAAVVDRFLGNSVGTDLIGELRAAFPEIVVAVVSGDPDYDTGADITVTKSASPAQLLQALQQRLARRA